MRTPDQYREFAAQCYHLAAEDTTEERRKIIEEMARAWKEMAEEAESRVGFAVEYRKLPERLPRS